MSSPYVPNCDADFLQWLRAFSGRIAAGPAVYGMSGPEVARLLSLADEFEARLHAATNPATRTRVTVAEKRAARIVADRFYRGCAQRIKLNYGVSDADKIALGLHLRPQTLSRRRVPTTSPLLRFIAATPGANTLRYADSLTPETRRKPPGARCLQLFVAIGDDKITDPALARYVGEYTKCPLGVDHEAREAGKVASYFGRWAGARGDHGPWSLPLHVTILYSGGAGAARRAEEAGPAMGNAEAIEERKLREAA
jgi:hypothetical protein